MNAQLKPITARAIERPTYENRNLDKGALWVRDNDATLREYYTALGRTLPQGSDDRLLEFSRAQNFIAFAQCQWDGERLRRMQ